MTARHGLPVLHDLAARWSWRRRLLAAVGGDPELFDGDDEDQAAGVAGDAVDRQRRHEIAARMAGAAG